MENVSVQNVNNNKKNIMFVLLAFVVTVVAAGVGATLAYLTKDTEKRVNPFTFGNVSIELTEEKWEELPPEDKVIYPEKVIPKDPVITNTGKNAAYVYMEVKVPMAEVRTYKDGKIQPAEMQPLFTFEVNSGWKLLEEPEDVKEEEAADVAAEAEEAENVKEDVKAPVKGNNYKVCLYVYEKPLASGKSIQLFDKVKVIPMLEGELDIKDNIEMPITAYAIQADFVPEKPDFKAVFEQYIKSED